MKKKRLFVNLISNLISFALQMGISFFLTPVIVEKVGDAAYGFIGLANNFASYATIFTVVINSMASRFITVELTKGNVKEANKYYSSVLIMDLLMSLIVLIVSTILILNLNLFLDIPEHLNKDVTITFILAFINLIVSIISTVYTVSTFAKNRLDIEAVRNIIGNILKAIFLIVVFTLCTPKIYYIIFGGLIMTIYLFIANVRITKKLAPELKFDIKLYDKSYIKVLMKSGIWNMINSLSKTLLTGVDLLIANVFIGADAMGVLSIAKTIPTCIENLLVTIANIFSPQFIILYSKHKIKELVESVNFSLKVTAFIMIVPIAGFIVFGEEFFAEWLPAKTESEIKLIQILSIFSLLPYIISSSNYTLFLLDTATNKLKRPVLATLIISVLSTLTTLFLLIKTDLGIYAVAGVSSIYWCIKVFFFNTINAAKNLRIKWNTFFNQFLKNLACFVFMLIVFEVTKKFVTINSGKQFLLIVSIWGIAGYILSFYILLNKAERLKLLKLIKNKLLKKQEN